MTSVARSLAARVAVASAPSRGPERKPPTAASRGEDPRGPSHGLRVQHPAHSRPTRALRRRRRRAHPPRRRQVRRGHGQGHPVPVEPRSQVGFRPENGNGRSRPAPGRVRRAAEARLREGPQRAVRAISPAVRVPRRRRPAGLPQGGRPDVLPPPPQPRGMWYQLAPSAKLMAPAFSPTTSSTRPASNPASSPCGRRGRPPAARSSTTRGSPTRSSSTLTTSTTARRVCHTCSTLPTTRGPPRRSSSWTSSSRPIRPRSSSRLSKFEGRTIRRRRVSAPRPARSWRLRCGETFRRCSDMRGWSG